MEPSKDQRVCSKHFIDGRPTASHPDSGLKLGYEIESGKHKSPKRPSDQVMPAAAYRLEQGVPENDET